MTVTNSHETAARERKVAKLVVTARKLGLRSHQLADNGDMGQVLREHLVEAAEVNQPSITTWSQVVGVLRIKEVNES